MRILIIDEDKTFCELLAETLEGAGIEAVWTTDGPDAIEKSLSGAFDVIILDVQMPLVSGAEVARAVKQEKPQAGVILSSTFADEALRRMASHLGASVLSKPFSTNDLLEMIEKIVSEGTH